MSNGGILSAEQPVGCKGKRLRRRVRKLRAQRDEARAERDEARADRDRVRAALDDVVRAVLEEYRESTVNGGEYEYRLIGKASGTAIDGSERYSRAAAWAEARQTWYPRTVQRRAVGPWHNDPEPLP